MTVARRSILRSAALLGAAVPLASCTTGRRGRGTDPTEPSTTPPPEDPDETLVIGSIGVSSGLFSTFEKHIMLAIGEARTDVNIAGGVFGRDVTLLERVVVDAPGADIAPAIAALRDQGATAIITSCSDESLIAAVPAFVDAGIAVVSVNSTARDLRADEVETEGMLMRISPTDACLAKVFSDAAWNAQPPLAAGTLAFFGRDTMGSASLAEELRLRLEPQGGHLIRTLFPEGASDVGAPVDALMAAPPALVVIDAGDETPQIVTAIATKSLGPDGRPMFDIPLRTTYYNTRSWGEQVPPESLKHATGCRPGIPAPDELVNTMLNVDTSLATSGFEFAGAAYDAVVLIALAAQAARSTEGSQIAAALPSLLTDGEEVADHATGLRQLAAGAQIRYVGRSGPIELGDDQDPVTIDLTDVPYDDAGQMGAPSDSTIDLSS